MVVRLTVFFFFFFCAACFDHVILSDELFRGSGHGEVLSRH